MPTFRTYITGFILSIALTLAAYFAVVNNVSNTLLIILIFAIIQLFVQLIFFLHLNQCSDRGWNFTVLFSTFSVILILVVGSLWIMNHLNYSHMPSEKEIIQSEGIHK